jgi:23S rRNA pseudouridine1911/1915/1917 synthase
MNHAPMTIHASPLDKGQRFDQFLTQKLSIPRAQVKKLIDAQDISSLGRAIKPSQAIVGHEIFMVSISPKPQILCPENIELDILYSDEDIAVINKPKGLVVHPGAGVKSGTLCHALLYHFPELLAEGGDRPGIVHRLDKDTSGVMVIAKNRWSLAQLSADFKDRLVKKIYRTLVWGEFDKCRFELKTGHARHPFHRLRFSTKIEPPVVPSGHVRFAHTSFEVIKCGMGISELKAILHTGRTHQIRAHLADIDHPVLGDILYGGGRNPSNKASLELKELITSLEGQALHAQELSFLHPKTKEPMSFKAEAPKVFEEIASLVGGQV